MKALTTKQNNLLTAIKEFISKNGISPTQRELMAILGYKHKRSIVDKLDALEVKGMLSRLAFIPRSITVNEG